jgi:hypothetical protein
MGLSSFSQPPSLSTIMKHQTHTPRNKALCLCLVRLGLGGILAAGAISAHAQGTAFTYQGVIQSNGVPLNGTVTLRPTLWDGSSGGTLIAGNSPTDFLATLTNGLFTTTLNFGSAFNGQPRWLQWEISSGGGPFTTLSPRQPVTPTPYAMVAGDVSGVIANSSLPPSPSFSGTVSASAFAGNGAGLTGLNASQLTTGTVPTAALDNAWKTTGNAGTSPGTHFVGTTDNQPLELRVNNARALRLQPNINSPNLVGGFSGNTISGSAAGSVIAGGGASSFTNSIDASSYAFIGGGRNNQILAVSTDAAIAGGANNRIESAFRAAILGGDGNSIATNANRSLIGGGLNNRILTNSSSSLISGGQDNQIGPNAATSVIGGGLFNRIQTNSSTAFLGGGQQNIINASDTVLVGGRLNEVSATGAFLGGGQENRIWANSPYSAIVSGRQNLLGPDADYAFIGGGFNHYVGVGAFYSAIVGGWQNDVGNNASYAAVGGGLGNTIQTNAFYATIPGGRNNSATNYAFAAGTRAKANHTGAFVWADSTDADFASTAANQFNVRANGGVRVDTGSGPGISLSAADTPLITRGWDAFGPTAPAAKQGHGRWGLFMEPSRLVIGIPSNDIPSRFFSVAKYHTNGTFTSLMTVDQNGAVTATSFTPTSDRNAKHRFQPVNVAEVLEKVANLSLTRWQFKEDSAGAWHLGPMAQDFHATFGLGANDTTIATVDADGVALAAIQGLNQKLERENAELKARLERLEKLLAEKLSGGAK